MKVIKYIILFTIVGFICGVIISIGIVGFTCSDIDSNHCKSGCSFFWDCLHPVNCLQGCIDGCLGCLDFDRCNDDGCIAGMIGGCVDGVCHTDGCIDFELGCEYCSEYCNLYTDTRKEDIEDIYVNIKDNSKAKNYIIYLTLIGAVIGFVFGTVSTIQDKRKQHQEVESNKKKLKQEAEDNMKKVEQYADRNRKAQKQEAEYKWEELKDRLNNH